MKIRFSERGLTFSFRETETFKAGTHYHYIIDNRNGEVILLPDENGKYRLSRKGKESKPLVDLRNAEIKSVMSEASYMEVEILDDKIVVHIIKTSVNISGMSDAEISDLIDRADEVTFSIDKETLKANDNALSEMLEASGLFSEKTRKDMEYVFDTVSLFSGAGLLDYPFAKDGSFDLKFAVDFDRSACETYRANIGDHILCMDIRELEDDKVPNCELVIGGPCCQGYSNANRAKNYERDLASRSLVDDYIRIVRAKKPLMFLIENVSGFITAENGRYLEKVLSELSDYHITYSVVNDADVGGYSTRKRMILIGSCREVGSVVIPDIEISHKKTVREAFEKVNSEWYNYSDVSKPNGETMYKMSMVKPGHNYTDIPDMKGLVRHSNVYRRLEWDKPSVTLTNWRKVCLMPPEGNRVLSVSEAAAIMGLDKDFKVLGDSLDRKQQQIGNGVTQAIARFVKNIIKNALYAFVNRRIPVNA